MRVVIDRDLTEIEDGTEINDTILYRCVFDNLRNVTLKNCDLNGSKFVTTRASKALRFTLTLNCGSFDNVEYSETLLKLFLYLLTRTKSNDGLRAKIAAILSDDDKEKFDSIFGRLE